MAEKEERICITKLGPNPSDCFLIDNTCDGMCVRCTQGMKRQEAINRIAKALYLFNREDEWYKEHADMYSKYMNKIAEAALNALLSK